jgi:hypothetical protein
VSQTNTISPALASPAGAVLPGGPWLAPAAATGELGGVRPGSRGVGEMQWESRVCPGEVGWGEGVGVGREKCVACDARAGHWVSEMRCVVCVLELESEAETYREQVKSDPAMKLATAAIVFQ